MVPWVNQCHPRYIMKVLAPRWLWDTKFPHLYFTYASAPLFSTITGPQIYRLFSLLGASVTAQSNANVDETKSKRIRAWDKWCKLLQSTGLRSDVFLDGFFRWKIHIVLVAFTQAVRQAEFLQGPKKRLVAATFRYTVGYLYQSFMADLRYYPKRDPYGSLSFQLEQTLWRSRREATKFITDNCSL